MRRRAWFATIVPAILYLVISLPHFASAVTGPIITVYIDSNELVISDTTATIVEFDDTTRDFQAVRLPNGEDYVIVVLVWQEQTLSLHLYSTDGTELSAATVLTAKHGKTISVSKLDYDSEPGAVRVRANLMNHSGRPTTLLTKWYSVKPAKSTPFQLQDMERQRIHYPKQALAADDAAAGLAYLNWEREAGGLFPVERLTALNDTCALHSEYMRLNDTITHYEEADQPGYTVDGYAAGTESNLTGQYNISLYNGVDILTAAIYHRLPMVRNNLHHIGWAISDESATGVRYGCLNVYAAEAWDVTNSLLQVQANYTTAYDPDNHKPLPFPGVHQPHVPIDFITGEHPDPIEAFGGTFPVGYPVSLIFSYNDVVSDLSMKLLSPSGQQLAGYFRAPDDPDDPNSAYQGNAVTFIPKQALHYGKTYTVKVSGQRNGEDYSKRWQFTTETFDENYPWDVE